MFREMIGAALLIVGLILLVGSVGSADYAIAARAAFDDFELIVKLIIASLMMLTGGYLKGWFK